MTSTPEPRPSSEPPVGPDAPFVMDNGLPPCFLNWAVDEIQRLHAQITPDVTREVKFRIQTEIATISGTAYRYGQWIYQHSP